MNEKIKYTFEILENFNINFDNEHFKEAIYKTILLQTIDKFKNMLTVTQINFILNNTHLCNEGFICIKTGNKNIIIDNQAELDDYVTNHLMNI